MGAGRPTTYTPEIGLEICTRIAQGQPLSRICREDPDMPAISTVYLWLESRPEFSDRYVRAREDQADTLADEIIDIADESKGENMPGVQSAALRVDARKWAASKLKPKKYMDSRAITGAEGGPVQIIISQDDSDL